MRTRYRVLAPNSTHFITSTVVQWLPVFNTNACCDILVGSLQYCRQHKGLQVYAWVIMPTHFHAIVSAPDLSGTLADLKKFTARRIVDQVKLEGREWLLNQFSYYRAAHKDTQHQVWQEGFHPEALESDSLMQQKSEYLHHNPVKAGFVASPEHWRYSSAHEWLTGAVPAMKCDSWR